VSSIKGQSASALAGLLAGPAEPAIEALFASPLFTFTIAGASALNVALLGEIDAMRTGDPGVRRSNRNGWHSKDDLFLRQEKALVHVRGHIVDCIRQATQKVAPRFDFARQLLQLEGWINVSGRGAYNAPHDHPAFAWSGVYYVAMPHQAEGDSGAIEFLDPRTNARVPTIEGAACFMDSRKLKPTPGMLLLFPSYLKHWVYPNEDDEARVTIAFNARYVPRKVGGAEP
jgi:uncharacterized protein (TIGR02466 family)